MSPSPLPGLPAQCSCDGVMPPAYIRPTRDGRREDYEYLKALGFNVEWTVTGGESIRAAGQTTCYAGGEGFGVAEKQMPHAVLTLKLRDNGHTIDEMLSRPVSERTDIMGRLLSDTGDWDYSNFEDTDQYLRAQEWLLTVLEIDPEERQRLARLARRMRAKARRQGIVISVVVGLAAPASAAWLYDDHAIASVAVGVVGLGFLWMGAAMLLNPETV